jgi:hypothetical protein
MKTFKVILMVIGATALGLFAIGFVQGFLEDTKNDRQTSSYNIENDFSPAKPEADKMTASERQAFLDGCDPSRSGDPSCICMFNYLDRTLTNKEFWDLADEVADGQIPDVMVDAAEFCL